MQCCVIEACVNAEESCLHTAPEKGDCFKFKEAEKEADEFFDKVEVKTKKIAAPKTQWTQSPPTDWQHMETAPKNGKIIGLMDDGLVFKIELQPYNDGRGMYHLWTREDDSSVGPCQPVGWIPFPAPPGKEEPEKVDGYMMLPTSLTAENGAKHLFNGEFKEEFTTRCFTCGEWGLDDECERCGGSGECSHEVAVTWDTIKDIWKMAVKHFKLKDGQE